MLNQIRQHAQSWGVKVAFGIIILVFVFWGVGGSNTSGPGVVATVNGTAILAQDFGRAVNNSEALARQRFPDISAEDLRSLQLPQQTLQMMISQTLVDQEAKRLGITVTPLELLNFLKNDPRFVGEDGNFDQAKYEESIRTYGMKVSDFEQDTMRMLRAEKLRSYVAGAVSVSAEEARSRFDFQAEQRIISYVLFPIDDFRKDISITDEQIQSYYDANQPQFLEPAATALSFVLINAENLAPSITVADDRVEEAYAVGPLRYNLRMIQLALPSGNDETAETAAKKRLDDFALALNGGTDFSAIVAELAADPAAGQAGEAGWMSSRQLSPEILAALAGLPKGGLSAPVRLSDSYVLLQLIETDPDWSQPEELIKAELRKSLAIEDAAMALRDVQEQAEDLIAMGKSVAEIAAEMKLELTSTLPVAREELPALLSLRRTPGGVLFDGEKGSVIPSVLETRDGFAVAEIAEQRPAQVRPLDDVRDLIRDVLSRREAEKRAEEAARQAAPLFADGKVPDEFKDRLVTSPAFSRQGFIPELGQVKALAEAAFSSPLGQWLQEPFASSQGAVLAMPVEKIASSDEDWARVEQQYISYIQSWKQEQAFSGYIVELGKNAQVRVVDPRALEQ